MFNKYWSANLLKCFDAFVVDKCWHVDGLDLIDLVVDRDNFNVDFG